MLGPILPGLREVRGPLAAGFLWMLLAWLLAHEDVAKAQGEVKGLVELGEKLNPAAVAAVASFVAYLVGSLSEDVFGRLLRLAIPPQQFKRTPGIPPDSLIGIHGLIQDPTTAILDRATKSTREEFEELTGAVRTAEMGRLENTADRLRAESDLRVAILPPLVVLLAYLSINEHAWWLLGLCFAAGLGVQAVTRTRDWFIARESLFILRRQAGVPPGSVAEVESREEAEKPKIKLWLLEHARKGRKLLEYSSPPTDVVETWADEASAFLREHAREDDAVRFLEISRGDTRLTLEAQVQALENIAIGY
jgi:hypothetical protein